MRDIIQWEGIFLSTLSLRRATHLSKFNTSQRVISIHALLAESDTLKKNSFISFSNFYPRSPCGERHSKCQCLPEYTQISIHALLAESDGLGFRHFCDDVSFLSTLSLRRATCKKSFRSLDTGHFYPRSPCGERRVLVVAILPRLTFLSTLSLRRATENRAQDLANVAFLSTLSLRRATELVLSLLEQLRHFYPRSPCGERRTV